VDYQSRYEKNQNSDKIDPIEEKEQIKYEKIASQKLQGNRRVWNNQLGEENKNNAKTLLQAGYNTVRDLYERKLPKNQDNLAEVEKTLAKVINSLPDTWKTIQKNQIKRRKYTNEEIQKLTSKQVYNQLIKTRYKEGKIFARERKLEKVTLSPKEREYWFKRRHNYIRINNTAKHWLKLKDGQAKTPECAMCQANKETMKHFKEDCPSAMKTLAKVAAELNIPNTDQTNPEEMKKYWNLEAEGMTDTQVERIARLGYIWYKEKLTCDNTNNKRKHNQDKILKKWKTGNDIADRAKEIQQTLKKNKTKSKKANYKKNNDTNERKQIRSRRHRYGTNIRFFNNNFINNYNNNNYNDNEGWYW
jgi:hypothetical protein